VTNYLIKICGIRDADMAVFAANAGANFIGIIFHPSSPRHVALAQAKDIAQVTYAAGAIPVAVFVDQESTEMRHICEFTKIKTIQLHGKIARKHHHLLSNDYVRIYVLSESQDEDNWQSLDQHRDFILVDYPDPGKGNVIDWQNFHYKLPFRWLLAGGLNPMNVKNAISILKPNGVDVSTGVETSIANKNGLLIEKFIAAVQVKNET
jgi:phosphoribosylanthranilate isomerase